MDLSEIPGAPFRRHPWEGARAKFFRRVLRNAGLVAGPRTILDVGAGDGYMTRMLLEALPAGSSAICFDPLYSAEDLLSYGEQAPASVTFTRERPTGKFDLILLLDVVEHVLDDRAFVGSLVTDSLATGGIVLVSVPAWPALFGRHDEALKHYRRYRPSAFLSMLVGEGLSPRRSGGLFHALLLARALTVASERVLARLGRQPAPPPNAGDWRGGSLFSFALDLGLAADNALSHALARSGPTALSAPGLSFWALCSGPAATTEAL